MHTKTWDQIYQTMLLEVMEELKQADDFYLQSWWEQGTPADRYWALDFFMEHDERELWERCRRLGLDG